jgi:hypothetical protein
MRSRAVSCAMSDLSPMLETLFSSIWRTCSFSLLATSFSSSHAPFLQYKGFEQPMYGELAAAETEKMKLLLRLVTVLCDCEGEDTKHLLRQQNNTLKSVNLISKIVRMLDTATRGFALDLHLTRPADAAQRKALVAENITLGLEVRACVHLCVYGYGYLHACMCVCALPFAWD